MNEKAVELLGQYAIEVRQTRKGRGAVICETDQGCLVFKEYSGSQERLALQNRILEQIADEGLVNAEKIVPDREGRLSVTDGDGTAYVLKTWREGRECSIHDREECIDAVRLLAKLHKNMTLKSELLLPPDFSQETEYDKHNRELKRVKKYLQQKGQKTWFEINLRNHFDYFLEQALAVTGEWKQYAAGMKEACEESEEAFFCHGDYQYHNILKDGNGWFVAGFEKFVRDNPVRDLCLLLRKILEKGNWPVSLGAELLEEYQKERSLTAGSWIDLYYRLAYPEKFWKIVNFYYNSGKAWIPGKNQEKLERVIAQEKEKQNFLDEVFRKVELG